MCTCVADSVLNFFANVTWKSAWKFKIEKFDVNSFERSDSEYEMPNVNKRKAVKILFSAS